MLNTDIRNIVCTEDTPIVATTQGKLRGFLADGIATFRGIRYAKAKRFLPPEEPDGWEGVRDAHNYGFICYNPAAHMRDHLVQDFDELPYDNFTLVRREWNESEHCQYLNIWSPELCPAKKKPVMVWIHGGGYTGGSALELEAYDGEALARRGDVVVVTVNHRLNMFGFMNLADYGEKYKNSVNAGILDLVAALQWVQKNIAAFGGDPDNVTIMGQSGGGGKIQALMQMECADGLYHKAIIQSGVIGVSMLAHTQESSRAQARAIVEALGLNEETIDEIANVPALKLVETANAVAKATTGAPFAGNWSPVPDDLYNGNAFLVGFRKETAHIPVIAGSNLMEFARAPRGDKKKLSGEQRNAVLSAAFGENAAAARAAFEKAWPTLDPVYASTADGGIRGMVCEYCALRTQQSDAPVYNYVFGYESPFWGGWMPQHSGEIAFMFHNAGTNETLCGGADCARIQEEMSGAWAAFAHTGSPNGAGLPEWKPFTEADRACMTYTNAVSQTRTGDFDRELRALAVAAGPGAHKK